MMTAMGLATLAGATIGTDPREPDFGKMRVGDTRLDWWAGIQQPMRLLARIFIGATDKAGWTGKHLTETQKDISPIDLVTRFAAFKLSPAITLPHEFYTGKDMVGQPVTPSESAVNAVTPMVYDDIVEAYKDGGLGRTAWTSPAAFLGTAVNTYPDSEAKTRRDIQKLIHDGKKAEAKAMAKEWNDKNPDDKIYSVRVGDADKAVELIRKPKGRRRDR